MQPKTFIDVSSHNGEISVDDYRALACQGVGGVVVKLIEDTWYNNPKAPSQVRNAQIAGLQVSTYHFSRYTTEEEARAEARFYIQAAQKLNLPKSTVMVNDFEDSKMLPNINRNTQAWVNEMRKHGYNNLMFYTSASWLDENNLGYRGPVSTSQFGIENFWVAQYPSTTLTATSAKNMRYNAKTGAWQFSATANLLPGKHVFDHSVDYTGRFTANASAEVDATQGDLSGTISIVNNNPTLGSFDVVISNVKAPNGVETVSVPIWSEINGQDDIIWYKATRQADGSYRVTIKATDHKNSLGNYRADVYIVDNANQRHYVTETIVDVKHNKPVGAISVVNNNKDTGTFDVIISDVYSSKGVRTVQVPIWSEKDGQDDIRWYEATRQANGTYTVNVQATSHKNSIGLYNIHLYYILNDGSRVGVGGTTTTVEFRNAKTKTQTYITNVNSEAGSFTVVVDQAPQGRRIQNIRVAVWSKSN